MDEPFSSYATPATAVLSNARVQAFRHPLVAPPPVGFNGGVVVDPSVPDHQRLRHSRYWRPVDHFDPAAGFALRLKGQFLYFGPIYDHFGHSMSEMVHRLIPALKLFGNARLLMVDALDTGPPRDYAQLPPFLLEILGLLGIGPDRVVIINKDMTVAQLSVCEQGSDFGGGPKAGYLPYLTEAISPRLDALYQGTLPLSKLYVSRSRHRPGGSFLGESYLEERLVEEGFTIFHPQEYSLLFQMQVYRSAEAIVFAEGSACHGTELLGEESLGDCHLLVRREDHREIFGRVLRTRSRSYHDLSGAITLGTAMLNPDDSPQSHLGVSLYRTDDLLAYFRGHGLARLAGFDKGEYVTRARADLARYGEAWGRDRSFHAAHYAAMRYAFGKKLHDEVV